MESRISNYVVYMGSRLVPLRRLADTGNGVVYIRTCRPVLKFQNWNILKVDPDGRARTWCIHPFDDISNWMDKTGASDND